MANYQLLIQRIITLLLLIIQDMVGSTSLRGDIVVDTNLTLNGSPYVVSQDLVVAVNATLTVQPGVQLHFDAGVGLRVKGSLHAEGNSRERIGFTRIPIKSSANMDNTTIYNNGIRLRDGNSYRDGRLEIFLKGLYGEWGTVCRHNWDMRDAEVACRQLGFLGATRYYIHGNGTGPIWLSDVDCKGTEKSLLECKHRNGYWYCDHNDDIGVECYGIEFSSSDKPSSIQYAEVSRAYEAIKGSEFLPDLEHVTIKSSVYGVVSDNASSPLAIKDSSISDNLFAGIQINSRSKNITIKNTVVNNTMKGHGLQYREILPGPVDVCSADVTTITTFPVIFQASGKPGMSVDCSKVIRTHPGHLLTVHFQYIAGDTFELDVHDGNNINASKLLHVTQWTGVNQAVTPLSSSGHELYIRFRYSTSRSSTGASIDFLIMDDRDVSSLVISNCTFHENHKNGVFLQDFTGNTTIDGTSVFRNKKNGVTAERMSGTITATNTHSINNSANGLEILDSSFLSCNLHKLSAKGNAQNGMYLQRVAVKSNVSQAAFNGNAYNGIAIANGAGEVELRNITAVLNKYSGIRIYDGQVSSNFIFCNFSNNLEDGCSISNQAGAYHFFNCTANSNLRHGITLSDPRRWSSSSPRHYFEQISLKQSTINDNANCGVKLAPERQYTGDSAVNVTIAISKNQFVRNRGGGVRLVPDNPSWQRSRRVEAIVRNNHFEKNNVNAFHVYCAGFLGLQAIIELNKFINNTDKVLTLIDNDIRGAKYGERNPVSVKIDGNVFIKNRAENILYIDYSSLPEARSAIVRNNTFKDNGVATKDAFPNFFRSSTTRAVIVLKEGTFTLRENILENSEYAYQLSTLRHDHRRAVDAKFNWWGTTKECEIVDRIFDFHHRIQLSPVEFFPYLLSANKTSAINSSVWRPSCFLRTSGIIGGTLDRPLTLSSADSPYEVRDDIIILTNGSLVIPKNVTLLFPSRSAMVVQGTLLVDGTENEKVRFVKKSYQGEFRLSEGAGPWAGRVDVLVNNSWLALCLPYNRSFTNEAVTICQQLNLHYQTYRLHSVRGREAGFVHTVVCDGNADEKIMNCSANTWRYEPTCSGFTVTVYCQQYNWAGLHLTLSNHQSSLHHLEILDAGYAYRSDIQIPGTALKIDLCHHNISNISINNSMGIGVQVVYKSVFYNQSLMPHSSISHTKSHGVLSRSPFFLTDVNLTRNDGNGFVYESTWDKLNTFTAKMASPDVYKTFHVCSENKTFLLANKVFYFTLETLKLSSHLRCHHVMETEPGYKLIIQGLYYSYRKYDFLHVYDGANASVGSPWKMESFSWKDHPVFNSTKSSVVFDFYRRVFFNLAINFLVYTVKAEIESEQFGFIGGHISIDRTKITSSAQRGVLVIGNLLKSLCITNTDITNSKDYGVQIASRGIKVVKVISTNLQQNLKGLVISHLPSTELTVENSVINGSVLEGVYIENDEESTIRIINSSITTSGGRAVCDNTDGSTVFVSGSTFSGNKFGTFLFYPAFKYLSTPSPCTVLFQSNHFIGNQRPTVDVRSKGSWVFLNNTFQKNRGISVISFQKVDSLVSLDVDGNLFMANQCPGKAVITVGGRVYSNEVVIRNNNFTLNSGRCVHFTDRTKRIPVSITNNVFHENYCEDKSVIEVLQMDENATFVGNVFTQNSAESVVLFEVMQDIHSSLQRKKVVFNNTLINNIAYTSSPMTIADDSCALVLYGVPSYREIHFGFNKFNNPKYQRELCVRFPALSTRDVVNVSHNWWGTVIDNEVRDRISDFDDNYDFAIADYWPFLLSNDGTASNTVEQRDFKQHGNVLSGRLFESITLKASHSPYSVTSDLTVLDNVTLTIEAGVTVTVSPGMSILVAGALQARGKPDKPVVFTVKEPAGSNKGSQIPLRLVDGDFPWEGRVEVFYNKSWTPVYSSNITTTTEVVCRQLGYGSPVAAVGNSEAFRRTVNEGWLTEFLCLGNETFIHECPTKRLPLNYIRMLGVVAKCQSAPWGNLRFVSSRDASVSQMPSVLKHVEFSHSGSRHGMSVPAIEAVENVPKLKSISIRNCLSGGLRIYSPRANVHVNNSTFVNTGQVGLSFVQTRRNILVESTESSRNQRGLSFEETSAQNVPRVHYGRVSLCSDETVVFVENQAHVYFDLQRPKDALLWLTCQKVIKVTRGRGIKLTLLYFKGTQWQKLEIYDSNITSNLIVSEWTKYMASLVHKEFFIPRDTILIRWTAGDVSTEVVFLTEAINIKDAPCTYELDLCGWQTFPNMSVNGINVTRTWKIATYAGPIVDNTYDYSYFSSNGKWLYVGNDRQPYVGGRAAIISPRITKLSKLCSVVFFYRVGKRGRARLSLYIQTGTFPTTEETLIWSAKNVEVSRWRKMIVELPNDIEEYRLLLEGEYKEASSHSRNYVTVDNLELRSCSVEGEHRISNSVFSGNIHQAISYTSVADESDERPSFTIERCKIINTNIPALSNITQRSATTIDIQDNNFTFANNFISGNRLGGIQARLGRSDGTSLPRSLIYGSTFSNNVNGTILIEERKESKGYYSFVNITDNIFENNLGWASTIKLSEVQSQIVNNFFYNNSGLHTIMYNFTSGSSKGHRCELNSLYLNKGLGQNYGVTIMSNGPMKYHRNNFKNPSNLYEFSSTSKAASDPIDARQNWWSVKKDSLVASRIYDKHDDFRLAAVEFKPFQKLPPRNILSTNCPATWQNEGSTCFVFRGGSTTLKEARNYCQYHGGHVASTHIPDDMKFINMAIETSRPDGKPPAPIWITTVGNVGEGKSGQWTSQLCTVITPNRVQKDIPCDSLYPFVCTTTTFAIQCYECSSQPYILGGTKCHSGSVGKIKCPSIYDRCMTMKYTMSLGQKGSASVELRNCSSSPSCDPKNEFYGCTLLNSTGMLTDCSLSCCRGDLCNLSSNKPKPTTKQTTTPRAKPTTKTMLTSTSLVYSTDPVPVKPPKAKSAGLVLAASFGVILLVLVLNISA